MCPTVAMVTLLVRDYDEAIRYFTLVLGFTLREDADLGEGKRWVIVAPSGSDGAAILLAKAVTEDEKSRIGNQTGGRVFLFLYTSDFQKDYQQMLSNGVQFLEQPRHEAYGWVVVFKDLYGNKWDFIQRKNP